MIRALLAPSTPDTVRPLLAPSVAFHSPVADYRGRDDVAHLLATIGRCLTDPEPGQRCEAERRRFEEFTAHVGDHPVDGVLIRRTGPEGLIEELTLFVRPLEPLQIAVAIMRDALRADPLPSRRR
ncbi:hypothetical protein [Pseudonocardia zijingensis]|uniref:SnoaL-like protein n=1 Tax=Pseudonocardia zijingensis TaxID=153376 RepID=A0ABN1N7A9_9PSEU